MNEHARTHDAETPRIGMWLFLFTEVLLFGGLFLLYAVYLHRYPDAFHLAGQGLDRPHGALNTVVLITSSLSMALAVTALQQGNGRAAQRRLLVTLALALTFLLVKYFEWSSHIHEGIYPQGPELLKLPPGEMIFFNLYYLMTGLHAVHVIIGSGVILFTLHKISVGSVNADNPAFLENAGLYWHLVDLVWIYLFPLFYLVV